MKLRIAFHGVAVAIAVCLAIATTSGCDHAPLTAIFVNHDNRGEVDMLRLVESPPGHLSGSLVISSLNPDGSRKTDAVHDVAGTISGPNVSLQLQGGLAGLAEFFGDAANLIGNLKGKTLTLSIGAQTEVFREITQKKYRDTLANLDKVGEQIATVKHAADALHSAESSGRRLNTDLKNYIDWGQQRIDHVPMVRQWYANRIGAYTKCLHTIRPLAASRVPSWRWQGCVLAIQSDEYSRDQEAQAIHDLQRQNHDTVAGLDARIQAAPQQFASLVNALKQACPYVKDVDGCEKEIRTSSLSPDGLLDGRVITNYRNIIPQISAAISTDMQTAASGQSSLSEIAQQVERVYQSAR